MALPPEATLLGAQDGQRLGQTAEEAPARGQRAPACDLAGRDQKEANEAVDSFLEVYGVKHDKACTCLKKDRTLLLTFYSFSGEHWRNLRTTNPIKSGFATIRHRARQTKGSGSRLTALAMMFKFGRGCEKGWRRLNGCEQIHQLIEGARVLDGIAENAA